MKDQLAYFDQAMRKYRDSGADGDGREATSTNWQRAFESLIACLEQTTIREHGKRVVFLDELAWLDTQNSGFLSALEHFWNDWGSRQNDLILIVCGSLSTWIIKKILKNRGGLHNRVTQRILLKPFTLSETWEFLRHKGINYDLRLVADAYMIFGGIPFYLNLIERGGGVAQSIDRICFADTAPLADEFEELYHSLFKHAEQHTVIVRALAKKRRGLSRDEIIEATGIPSGGNLSDLLTELEQTGFLRRYDTYAGSSERTLYQLVDLFSVFYLTFMDGTGQKDSHFWMNNHSSNALNSWNGYAFELLCLLHSDQIRDALGILGTSTAIYAWRDPSPKSNRQIDLVLDRKDGVIDLCEMKYYQNEFVIDSAYADKLTTRRDAFISQLKKPRTVHLVFITRSGLKENSYRHLVDASLSLEDLLDRRRISIL
jgi:hypothetical protein